MTRQKWCIVQLNEKNGWFINWDEVPKECSVCALKLKGSDVVQGLASFLVEPANQAVRGHWIVAAPHNRGNNRIHDGVGGHLFAIMINASIEAGYDGFIYGMAANKKLLKHYEEEMGATPIGGLRFCVYEEQAHKLLEIYTFEKE